MVQIATAFARFGSDRFQESEFNAAARRLRTACMTNSFFVAGSGNFCTEVMAATDQRAFVKTGAEGVYTGCLPGTGLGIAVKTVDGTKRAAQTAMAGILAVLLGQSGDVPQIVQDYAVAKLRNRNNWVTGEMSLAAESRSALQTALSAFQG